MLKALGTKETLKVARDLIAQGWVQDVMYSDGGYCSIGAIEKAAWPGPGSSTSYGEYYGACAAITKALGIQTTEPRVEIIQWNDAAGRTQAQVLAAFDKAIEATNG